MRTHASWGAALAASLCLFGPELIAQAAPRPTGSGGRDTSAKPTATVEAAVRPGQTTSAVPAPSAAQRAPTEDSLTIGGRLIREGETVRGPVVVAGGDLEVRGTVEGTAIALAGDVMVRKGGRVTGDAIAVFGGVVADSGTIGGAMRSITGRWGSSLRSAAEAAETPSASGRSAFKLALGSFCVILLIGLGVLVFAGNYLAGVVDVLEESFWRSFLVGIAGEIGLLPALILLVVALTVTIIGALLIPFALVAFLLAVAGLFTLGFIAVARVTGDGVASRTAGRLSQRGSALRGVVVGVSIYMGLWLIAAALGWAPVANTLLRVVALLVTYVAMTAGFGAALLSRGGTRRDAAVRYVPAPAMDSAAWQTPTPIPGVVAARRPQTPKGSAPR